MATPSTTERERIREVVHGLACELHPGRTLEPLRDATHLDYDLGLGSLERVELVRRLETALGRSVVAERVLGASTCADLLDLADTSLETQAPAATPRAPHGGAGAHTSKNGLGSNVQALTPGLAPPPPQEATTLTEMLAYQAAAQGSRPVLLFEKEGQPWCTWSYPDLVAQGGQAAHSLAALGVLPGQRVGLMLPTGPEFVACFFGILMQGAIPVPLYPPFRPDQLEEHVTRQAAILTNAGVTVLIGFAQMRAVARLLRLHAPGVAHVVEAAHLLDPARSQAPPLARAEVEKHSETASEQALHEGYEDELALIQYTSGSTGLPKGVALTHRNLLANIRAYGQGLDMRPDDVCVSWLPLYHDMGLIGTLLGSVYYGIPLVLMGPQDFLARPARWLQAISRHRATISAAPNFAYELCTRKLSEAECANLDLSCWRVSLNGAEAVRPATLEGFAARFAAYGLREHMQLPVFGLAEATLGVTFCPLGRAPRIDRVERRRLEEQGLAWPEAGEDALAFVSCGRPLEHMEIRVVDEAGRVLDERHVGRLQFRGPSALREYFGNPEATRAIKSADGWVDTGDQAYLADGELYITGRLKDIILKGGRNLHAEDLEDAAATVAGVRRGCSAAFALNDPSQGTEQLVVVVESLLTEAAATRDLETRVQRAISEAVGLPADRVVVVPPRSVPKTPSGKIRRSECRKRLLEGSLGVRRSTPEQALALLGTGLKVALLKARALPQAWLQATLWGLGLGSVWLTLLVLGQFSPRLAQGVCSFLCRLVLRLARVHVQVQGPRPRRKPYVLVANHASSLDPIILLAASVHPLRFVMADWVARTPLLRWLYQPLGHLAIQRGDARQAVTMMASLQQSLRDGQCVALFPEGGLEVAPGLRPFALGAFEVARAAGCDVIPVSLNGSRERMPWPRQVPSPGVIQVTFGEALQDSGDGWQSTLALAHAARASIALHCGEPVVHSRLVRRDGSENNPESPTSGST